MDVKSGTADLKFSSFEELEKFFDINLKKHAPMKVLKRLKTLNLLEEATSLQNMGHEEDAYIKVMRLLSIIAYISTSKDYQQHQEYYKQMIGNQFPAAVSLAEKIKANLTVLYAKKQQKNEAVRETPKKEVAQPVVEKNVTSCGQLFALIKGSENKLLILDARPPQDYENSRIKKMDNVSATIDIINVPSHIIKPGISAQRVEQGLPAEYLPIWKERGSYDQVFILDKGSVERTAHLLQKLLTEFDQTKYRGTICVVDGGYSDWINLYPWTSTNPRDVEQPVEDTPVINIANIDFDLNFDVQPDVVKPYFDRATKPRQEDDKWIPMVDRSAKPTALHQDAGKAELLRQKDAETMAALQVEKERLRRERDLQEELRRQKEQQLDEERFAIIVEELDELKLQSMDKDATIRELQKRLEESEKDTPPSNEEIEIEEKIKRQEEETEQVKRESDALEKEAEKKLLARGVKLHHESFSNQIRPVAYAPERPRIPYINRASKPKSAPILLNPVIGESAGLTGLKNLGNTCYMNSILQCISNNSSLARYFAGAHYLDDINRSHRTRGEVAEKMAGVVKALWSGEKRSFSCIEFKQAVGSIKSEYKSYEQQDSHEFLTFLMDWLHNDLKKDPMGDPQRGQEIQSDVEKAWINFKMKNESFISTLFYGLQKSTVTCLRCTEQSATYEPFSNLSLIIPDGNDVTLQACLKLYLKRELISGWRCPKCKTERQAEKRTELCKLPTILVIHLKRFSFLDVQSSKRNAYVDFPLDNLRLDDLHPESYDLFGVSNHYGTMQGGHYTAYCMNTLYKRWYKFDDHEVFELSPKDVKTNAAYILFYNSSKISS